VDAAQLAKQVLNVLDLQQEYFRTRTTEKLQESKAAERKIRQACKAILNPEQNQPALFGGAGDGS
jgi:hypothetical protein